MLEFPQTMRSWKTGWHMTLNEPVYISFSFLKFNDILLPLYRMVWGSMNSKRLVHTQRAAIIIINFLKNSLSSFRQGWIIITTIWWIVLLILSTDFFFIFFSLLSFTTHYVAQTDLKLEILLPHLPHARITFVFHHAQLFSFIFFLLQNILSSTSNHTQKCKAINL